MSSLFSQQGMSFVGSKLDSANLAKIRQEWDSLPTRQKKYLLGLEQTRRADKALHDQEAKDAKERLKALKEAAAAQEAMAKKAAEMRMALAAGAAGVGVAKASILGLASAASPVA